MLQSQSPLSEKPVDVRDLDATELKKKLTERTLTSLEITKKYIDHLKQVNPAVNGIVEERYSNALKEAEVADHLIAQGNEAGSLTGIPVTIKESFHVKGMHTTGGLHLRSRQKQSTDARIVEKLKSEGAIILGKSNTPSLCFCQETDNKLFGRTNNPWDVNRTPGGSSGGEAALIALGGAAAGIGSDIGGSIRFPAHFNGVIGFKSGRGRVSHAGSYPEVLHPLQQRMYGIGPITKSVRDARMVYQAIADHEYDTRMNVHDFTIYTLPKGSAILHEFIEQKLEEMIDYLNKFFEVGIETPPFFNESASIWQEVMSIDGGKSTAKEAGFSGTGSVITHFIKEKISGKSDYHVFLTWALIGARLFKPGKKRILEIERTIEKGDRQNEKFFDRNILVLPVYHRTAPFHGELYSEIFSIRKTFKKYMPFAAYANVWGLPSLTVPLGKDDGGLPFGVQFISKNGNEEALFQLGEIIEKGFARFQRCRLHDS